MGYYGPRGYYYFYYNPLREKADCGETPDRDSAVAALMALSSMLRRGLGAIAFIIIFSFLFIFIAFFIISSFPGGLGQLTIPLMGLFVIVPLAIALIPTTRYLRYRKVANALIELARLVDKGLLDPKEVCGKTAETLYELYILRYSGGRLRAYTNPKMAERRDEWSI